MGCKLGSPDFGKLPDDCAKGLEDVFTSACNADQEYDEPTDLLRLRRSVRDTKVQATIDAANIRAIASHVSRMLCKTMNVDLNI